MSKNCSLRLKTIFQKSDKQLITEIIVGMYFLSAGLNNKFLHILIGSVLIIVNTKDSKICIVILIGRIDTAQYTEYMVSSVILLVNNINCFL